MREEYDFKKSRKNPYIKKNNRFSENNARGLLDLSRKTISTEANNEKTNNLSCE